MPITYVPLFIDMLSDHFEDLTDAEVGQIVRAALLFAAEGVEPDFERRSVLGLTWKRMRAHVIQCMEKSETNKANGSKGGRPKNPTKPNETEKNRKKPKETEENPTKPNETKKNHEQEQEQEQSQEQEQYQEQEQEQEHINAPAPATDDRILAFDGTDLTEDIKRYDLADSMIRTYGMVDSDQTRNALIEDLEKHGEQKLRDVLKEAALSNSRQKVSVKFYRAVLEGKGGKSRAAPDYMKRQYTDDHWKSIEVNLDAG